MSLKTNLLKNSNIKCPVKYNWETTITNDEYKELLMMSGYIRELTEILNISYPPIYIIKLLQSYYCLEFIHLFTMASSNFKHWMISTDDIFDEKDYLK